MSKKSDKDLEDKIRELQKKLSEGNKDYKTEKNSETEWMKKDTITPFDNEKTDEERAKFVIASSPIGHNKLDTMKQISDAKKNAEQKAGLIRLSDDGSVWEEDEPIDIKIPSKSIHTFDNLEFCECRCHENGKKDCMYCYDHPTHLEAKREMRKPPTESESTQSESKPTKSRLKRFLDW